MMFGNIFANKGGFTFFILDDIFNGLYNYYAN